MGRIRSIVMVFALSALSAFTLCSCSTPPVDENDPGSLFEDAERDIKSDRFQIAIDKLRMVRNKFPYSKFSVEAQLRMADVYFLQESWTEAAASYEMFADLHPKHAKVEYASYRAAESFYQDMPSTVARDMEPGERALKGFETFLKKFPSDPLAKDAKKRVTEVRNKLAEKELYIANFYLRRSNYDAAGMRLEKLIELYPETETANRARGQLAELKNRGKLGPKT